MKTVLILALIASVALASPSFDSFLSKYGKSYTGREYARRMKIFQHNMMELSHLRSAHPEGTYDVTQFFDMTQEEFQSTMLMAPMPADSFAKACLAGTVYQPHLPEGFQAPDSLDWSTNPAIVSTPQDQGGCGSCWAFSTAENIEGQYGMAGKSSGLLSPQYVIDCSTGCSTEWYNGANTTVCNLGCNGGWPWTAFQDLVKLGGLPTWTADPYTGWTTGSCGNFAGKFPISGYTCFTDGSMKNLDETSMMNYLAQYGPLSIALNANYFNYYSSGVANWPSCPTNYLNHAVLLVGYGTDNGTPYWKVKNSWGPSWGENGYIRMYRGNGLCGINEAVSTANL